jgi:hypothetical protein
MCYTNVVTGVEGIEPFSGVLEALDKRTENNGMTRGDEDGDVMSATLAELTEKLVTVSDFSQGKASRIFTDVAENNNEYIVLKNNQPTAVVAEEVLSDNAYFYDRTEERLTMLKEEAVSPAV